MKLPAVKYISDLQAHSARNEGYNDALKALSQVLGALEQEANQAFQFQRETDSGYIDPRTDYLLGKLDLYRKLLTELEKGTK